MKKLLLLLSLIICSLSMLAQGDPYNLDGKIFNIENIANGKYLNGNAQTHGKNETNVMVWPAGKENWMQWKFEYVKKGKLGGLYLIINQHEEASKYKYLEVSSHEVGKNGGKIQLWEKHDEERQRVYGDNQLWQVYKNNDGTYSIASAHAKSGGAYVMEIPKNELTKNGTEVQIYWNRGYQHQKWYIKPVSKATK